LRPSNLIKSEGKREVFNLKESIQVVVEANIHNQSKLLLYSRTPWSYAQIIFLANSASLGVVNKDPTMARSPPKYLIR